MTPHIRPIPLTMSVMLVVCAAGCTNYVGPYDRTDVWHPTGSNAGNLAAMAVRPTDLIRGKNGQQGDARQAATAIDHVWQGHPQPLGAGTETPAPGAGAAPGPGAN
jgi:hypothetical protein